MSMDRYMVSKEHQHMKGRTGCYCIYCNAELVRATTPISAFFYLYMIACVFVFVVNKGISYTSTFFSESRGTGKTTLIVLVILIGLALIVNDVVCSGYVAKNKTVKRHPLMHSVVLLSVFGIYGAFLITLTTSPAEYLDFNYLWIFALCFTPIMWYNFINIMTCILMDAVAMLMLVLLYNGSLLFAIPAVTCIAQIVLTIILAHKQKHGKCICDDPRCCSKTEETK